MKNLTHFNKKGNVHMVDIADKDDTKRSAIANGKIIMHLDTLKIIKSGLSKKGDVIQVARVAAIQASKKTSELIPLCHTISISNVEVDFITKTRERCILCSVKVESTGKTGVEMEALVSVQIGLLTIYDMVKSIDRGMIITDVGLEKKIGGKSGIWQRNIRKS
ncbi:MAG: cyclic pyranopterin monophosphate synthase MoaC [Betaproteobacteria bacterium TMED156]|nr:MAG: cyclic pyranopterin monophosphate synthase MoaC [Betaproteobacteria bacterium TMED156]